MNENSISLNIKESDAAEINGAIQVWRINYSRY